MGPPIDVGFSVPNPGPTHHSNVPKADRSVLFRRGDARRWRSDQAEKLDPQPQELVALGFWNTKPRPMSSSLKSTVVPFR